MPPPTTKFVLVPPDNQTAEGWLLQFDSRPALMPTWPLSERMTLVAVVATGYGLPDDGSDSEAIVLTDPSQVDQLIDFNRPTHERLALFFTVARERVMPLVPGLTDDAWSKS